MALWLLRIVGSFCGFTYCAEFEAANPLTSDTPKVAMFFAANRKCYTAAIEKASQVAAGEDTGSRKAARRSPLPHRFFGAWRLSGGVRLPSITHRWVGSKKTKAAL
jgi:hypothetical protein